jgi:alkylmercury lyase
MTSPTKQTAIKTHEDFVAAHPEQFRLFLSLLRLLAKGKPVSPEELTSTLHRSPQEIQAVLQTWDVQVDHDGNIQASGLSLMPTPHQFYLGEQALYAWCALDTLAFPILLDCTARVISTCPVTGKEIRLTVTPEAIQDFSPEGAVVSIRLPGEETSLCHVQEDLCNDGRFFVSHEVASTWPSLHPNAVLLPVEEATEVGRVLASAIRSIALERELR